MSCFFSGPAQKIPGTGRPVKYQVKCDNFREDSYFFNEMISNSILAYWMQTLQLQNELGQRETYNTIYTYSKDISGCTSVQFSQIIRYLHKEVLGPPKSASWSES